MSSKSLVHRVDWNNITKAVHKVDLPKINKLKSQVDTTVAKCTQLPDALPKIDWDSYKATASDPKLVEEIQKKYNSIKIDKPKIPANRVEEMEAAKKEDLERFQRYSVLANSFIESAEVVKNKFEKMIPYHKMSEEDWTRTFPLWSMTYENPSLFPHFGRSIGLSKEEAAAFEQPDPQPFSTKTAWKHWEERKKKFYS